MRALVAKHSEQLESLRADCGLYTSEMITYNFPKLKELMMDFDNNNDIRHTIAWFDKVIECTQLLEMLHVFGCPFKAKSNMKWIEDILKHK